MKQWHRIVLGVIILCSTVSQAFGTTVDVYVQCTYTDDTVTAEIYADIAPSALGPLASAGVKLEYPADKLATPKASNNEKDWYLGPPQTPYPYPEPDAAISGQVVFFLGKADSGNPMAGVHGEGILLASVVFDRIPGQDAPTREDFAIYDGKPSPFVDFATVEGHGLDDQVAFSILPPISGASFYLRNVAAILQLLAGTPPDLPIRTSDLDQDQNGLVEMGDAVHLLRKTANPDYALP